MYARLRHGQTRGRSSEPTFHRVTSSRTPPPHNRRHRYGGGGRREWESVALTGDAYQTDSKPFPVGSGIWLPGDYEITCQT